MSSFLSAPITRPETDSNPARLESIYHVEPGMAAGMDFVPDGRYQVVVEDAVLVRGSRAGNALLTYSLRVQGPHHAGMFLIKRTSIHEHSLSQVTRDLGICGLESVRIADLQDQLLEIIHAEIEVAKTSSRSGDVLIRFQKPAGGRSYAGDEDEDEL